MHVYDWIVSISWLVFIVYWLVSAIGAKRSVGRNWSWLIARVLFIIGVTLLLDSHTFNLADLQFSNHSYNPLVEGIGTILCVLGVAFAVWARVYLGKNWGMPMSVKQEPELVTGGPYHYVRHPIYSGVLLAMIGTALVVGLWWLILFVFASSYFIYSATQEEKLMMREFPNQYPEYKKRTKMLIPFVL